ncbi:MAG: hypothetical protein CVV41_14665 [Candidatus Riflebacteria bacterium HGW-Riflebacteria-1]|jgi:PAS domain S-box-containing protein|nr:MAG: hypothetical protein CVV41_14665 [Candidatus Riflebacteria bacterium HGW-Riflebacteria-1]
MKLISLFENADVGLFVIALKGHKFINANFSFARILGYKSMESFFSDFTWEKHFSIAGQSDPFDLSCGNVTTGYREMRICRVDGTMGWVNFSFGIYIKTGYIDGIVVDISDLKSLEQEIVRISDLEREKFGRDLHDTLGQTLTGTAFLCRALIHRLPKKPAMIEERVGQIENLVNQALDQARHLAHGLAYIEVKPSGILSHLKKLAAQANAVFGGDCKVKAVSKVVLRDAESATHLYRIAQEAVHNAIKHSGSPKVEIRLEINAETGRMTVKDFGKGLPSRSSRPRGIGLQLMRLRARLIGGSIRFVNRRERGFQVVCTFPLAKENAK